MLLLVQQSPQHVQHRNKLVLLPLLPLHQLRHIKLPVLQLLLQPNLRARDCLLTWLVPLRKFPFPVPTFIHRPPLFFHHYPNSILILRIQRCSSRFLHRPRNRRFLRRRLLCASRSSSSSKQRGYSGEWCTEQQLGS